MTAIEFRDALKTLGMSQRFFALNSRSAISTVNRWAQGTQPIPGWVDWVIALSLQIQRIQ
jgi:uncharacterized protein YfdQ (DUF2303 family)